MKNADEWAPTTALAQRYKVEAATVTAWVYMDRFPKAAKRRQSPGAPVEWHVPTVDMWLRDRPVARRQRPARWWSVVGHPGYRRQGDAAHG